MLHEFRVNEKNASIVLHQIIGTNWEFLGNFLHLSFASTTPRTSATYRNTRVLELVSGRKGGIPTPSAGFLRGFHGASRVAPLCPCMRTRSRPGGWTGIGTGKAAAAGGASRISPSRRMQRVAQSDRSLPPHRSPEHLPAARGLYERGVPNQCPSICWLLFTRGRSEPSAALPHSPAHLWGLYLRPKVYNKFLRNSRGKITIPPFAASAEEAPAASRAALVAASRGMPGPGRAALSQVVPPGRRGALLGSVP